MIYKSSIRKVISESAVSKYTNSEMGELFVSNPVEYSERVSKQFVQKALWNDESIWYVVEEDGKIFAAAPTVEVEGSLLVEEFMSFKKGAGAELLLYILSLNYDMIYLFADWSQPDSLLKYYRDKKFGMTEKVMKNDPSHDTHYFYLNKKLSPKKLEKFIEDHFII